jgi:hypothetical protein
VTVMLGCSSSRTGGASSQQPQGTPMPRFERCTLNNMYLVVYVSVLSFRLAYNAVFRPQPFLPASEPIRLPTRVGTKAVCAVLGVLQGWLLFEVACCARDAALGKEVVNTVGTTVLSGPVGAYVQVAAVLGFCLHCLVGCFVVGEPMQASSGPACTALCTCVENQ